MKNKPKPNPAAIEPALKKATTEGTVGSFELTRRHLRYGWWSLLFFLTLGIVLESFHGWKAGFYLDASQSTRRLMWTLAHAHGTLFGLVNLAFAFTNQLLDNWRARSLASGCLIAGSLLMPSGFFLGGWVSYGGDPGIGILLVPLGAVLMFVAVILTARACTRW